MEEKVRVSKLLSELGLCSRREADSHIEQGLVTVDGEVVNELGGGVPFAKNRVAVGRQSTASFSRYYHSE